MPEYKDYGNIFAHIPDDIPEELFNTILEDSGLRIERIVSLGQCTAKDQWLEQDRDEWVFLVKGSAKLSFKGRSRTVVLKQGDYLFIKAQAKHRVEWTDPDQKTIWLAVHGQPKKK